MITQEQINISIQVVTEIEKYPESVLFLLDNIADDNCQCNADLQFVNETLKRHKNLLLMLDIAESRYDFIVNAVFHYRILLLENKLNQVNDYISRELAQRDIIDLFKYYNSIKIEIPESYVF
ncbi:hypothetical protein BC952_1701 [Flavobacterium limicola]|uniref:Uncharacterized protein n=1 Tax=Flavobacterium limicola TaxID=180441 RepID=A0A495S2D2_9FLAO|nr:hypothetical protein [Flavobacterium limicola]RKS93851.1 hypothetical protein BC952_1701 [Flavobacterium limicola]